MNAPSRLQAANANALKVAFTSRDFDQMVGSGAFSDIRVELVAGALEKMMPSHMSHGERNVSVAVLLTNVFAGQGVRLGCDVVVRIDDFTTRAADIVVTQPGVEQPGALRGEDLLLVVEIAESSLARDLAKAEDYARCGIATYWVVDLGSETTIVMTGAGPDGYANRAVVRFGEPIGVPGAGGSIVID